MAYNVYIRGLSRAGFRVPKVGGGYAKVTSAGTVQVDLDDHKTQLILNGERDNFVRVSGAGATTVQIIGLTRYGFRIKNNAGTIVKIKLGHAAETVNLTDYKTCRVLRRNYGRYFVGATTTLTIRGTHNQESGFEVGLGAKATATLTSNNTNPTAGDTVTINNVTYRFESTLALANDVKIGANADATLGSLVKAVNQTGVVGTDYFTGTVAPTGVTAGAENATTHTVVFTATAAGPAANSFASTDTSATLSFGATTFTGGGTGVGNSNSQTPTKVYRGVSVTVDASQPFNYGVLRRHYQDWIEA